MVSPSGHDVLTVHCKQAVKVPPDVRCTARHLQVLREALTAPRCTSGADTGERVDEQSHQPAVQGDALHHWSSGSSPVPPCSAAGALDVPRLSACLRGRPSPEGAPGGTFGSIPQDWDMISKIRAHHRMRCNELSPATAAQTSVGQALDAEVVHRLHHFSTGPTLYSTCTVDRRPYTPRRTQLCAVACGSHDMVVACVVAGL